MKKIEMITSEEIKQQADKFKIYPSSVEKDYVYGWILNQMYSDTDLASRMVLKGGNCIRKGYLLNSRFSKDLDFSVQQQISPDYFVEKINSICEKVSENTGIIFDLENTKLFSKNIPTIKNEILEARIYFKGFFNEENITLKAQLDLTQFDRIYLPIQEKQLIHPYSDSNKCSGIIKCQKFEEIIASKLDTLLRRHRVADLFDLFFSVMKSREPKLDRLEIITTFLKKTIYESNPEGARNELIKIPLDVFKKEWDTLTVPNTLRLKFEEVERGFTVLINDLFQLIPISRQSAAYPGSFTSAPIYFPSGFRSKILEGGRNRTLIRMSYDGYMRYVEPYSFRYRVRPSDGIGVEYFFGYDRTGGKSGKPSIKKFIVDKIESIEVTTQQFNPQWPIEL